MYIYDFNLRMQINNVDFIVKNKCESTEIKQSRYTLYNVYPAAHTRIDVSNQKEPSYVFYYCVEFRFTLHKSYYL